MFYHWKGGGWRRQFIGVPGINFFHRTSVNMILGHIPLIENFSMTSHLLLLGYYQASKSLSSTGLHLFQAPNLPHQTRPQISLVHLYWEKIEKRFSIFEFRLGINFFHFRLGSFEEVGSRLGSPGAGVEIDTG